MANLPIPAVDFRLICKEHKLSWGEVKTTLGYKKTGNKIKHASKEYNYYVTGMDWCSSYASAGRCVYSGEGGYGEFETDK